MKLWLRSSAAQATDQLMATRRDAIRAALAERDGSASDSGMSGQESGSDSDEMPPLLPVDADEADAAAVSGAGSASSSSSGFAPPSASKGAESWSAFQPSRVRCNADYSCCLRYALRLATCCMPRPADFQCVPSFAWLQSRFYPLHADTATLAFLRECDENFFVRGWASWWGLRVALLKPMLRRCLSHTDVNGLLRCGKMFLVSAEQIRVLLQQSIPNEIRGQRGVEWPWSVPTDGNSGGGGGGSRRTRLLDVGAGDGHITAEVSRYFSETVTTEVAPQMVRRLRSRGWECVHTGDLDEGLPVGGPLVGEGFDCVTLFNVLDRCSRPRTLLAQILARMRKPSAATGGLNSSRLVLSVPLPLDPSVEVGTRWLDPEESILSSSRSARDFESSSCALAEMLLSVGFNIESFSRLPYLSQGDTHRPFYVLDCSIWVLSARGDGPMPKDDEEHRRATAAAAALAHGSAGAGAGANNHNAGARSAAAVSSSHAVRVSGGVGQGASALLDMTAEVD